MYISDAVTLKPKQLHAIDTCITDTVKSIGVIETRNLPKVFVVSHAEMQTGALATFNPKTNKLLLDSNVGTTKKLIEMQKGCACPDNPLSTFVHEYLHWTDAQNYIAANGEITDVEKNLSKIRDGCRKKLEKLSKNG